METLKTMLIRHSCRDYTDAQITEEQLQTISKADTGEIAFANAACMVENMSLMATDLGLGHVYIYGMLRVLENNPEFAKSLELPEGFRPISGIVLGYEKNPRTQEREVPLDRVATNYIR